MARDFNGTSDYLISGQVLNAAPLTVSAWVEKVAIGAMIDVTVFQLVDTNQSNPNRNCFLLTFNPSSPLNRIQADFSTFSSSSSLGTATSPFYTSTDHADGTWFHVGGKTSSATSRYAYLDGLPGTENTTNRAPDVQSIDTTIIGASTSSAGPVTFFNARIAEVGVWNVALTDAEMATLGAGVCPLFVRPESLVAYWPLRGRTSPEIELINRGELTVNGAVYGDHPGIVYNSRSKVFIPATVASLDIVFSEGEQQDFIVEAPVDTLNAPLDIVSDLQVDHQQTVNEIPTPTGGTSPTIFRHPAIRPGHR